MKVILDGTENEPFDPATDLRVLVAYANAAFGLRAKATLQQVGEALGKPGRVLYSLWDFSCLAEPMLLRIAADDALASDIIFIAAQEGKNLPKAVRDWVSRWMLMKKNFPQALVASLHRDQEPAQTEPVLLRYLARVAQDGGMQFFDGGIDGKAARNLRDVRAEFAGESARADTAAAPLPTTQTDPQSGLAHIYTTMTPATRPACPATG